MSGDKVSSNLRVQRNDANNTWIACVELPDGHRVHSENMDRYTAIEDVKKLARHHSNITTIKPKDISELRPITQDQITQHASHLQKLMAGLIEKAKREGLDGRLLAMANTDFERGFMALDKAINSK